jgi:hypothetical protein
MEGRDTDTTLCRTAGCERITVNIGELAASGRDCQDEALFVHNSQKPAHRRQALTAGERQEGAALRSENVRSLSYHGGYGGREP